MNPKKESTGTDILVDTKERRQKSNRDSKYKEMEQDDREQGKENLEGKFQSMKLGGNAEEKPKINSSNQMSCEEQGFLETLNHCLFENSSDKSDYFPLKIIVEGSDYEIEKALSGRREKLNLDGRVITLTRKQQADDVVKTLLEHKLQVDFDYSNFISYPGNLFVRNLSDKMIDYDRLYDFFQSNCKYKSLQDINIFNSVEDDVFAIIKFQNYLDVDHLLTNLHVNENPFNTDPKVPLYLNKYISKRERKFKTTENTLASDNLNNFSTIFLENLLEFFLEEPVSLEVMNDFVNKFAIFTKVDSIYFPVIQVDQASVRPMKFGFISFQMRENLHLKVLECLYYLNNLGFDEFMRFSADDLYDIQQDLHKKEPEISNPLGLRITIGQHKHNHYLYQYQTNQFLSFESGNINIRFLDLSLHNHIISTFSKFVNYQETNIYVNNFPIVFENNDSLWEKFWLQFGDSIKSAKIIKPQFYTKRDDVELGKIGFVFYRDLKMALRAILLTNNKLITFANFKKVLIQTSFSIQKNNHHHQRFSYPTNNAAPGNNNPSFYPKRTSLPMANDFYFMQPFTAPPFSAPGFMPPAPPPPPPISGSTPQNNSNGSEFFQFYNPFFYPLNYNYLPVEGEHQKEGSSGNSSPQLAYYFPYYQFSPIKESPNQNLSGGSSIKSIAKKPSHKKKN